MVTERYRGVLALHDHHEAIDILYISSCHDPLAEIIKDDMDRHGHYLTVRYWTADKACGDEEMTEGAIRELLGYGDAEFHHAYSEITGYLWTDESITAGGHDLLGELRAQAGRYCLLEISYSKDAV